MSEELNEKDMFSAMFMQLVYSFQNMAVMQLGKLMNPQTNKVEKDLPQAKGTIDLIRMLKEKTKGNLSAKESEFLDQILLNLQLNYADEVVKGEKKQDGTDEKSAD